MSGPLLSVRDLRATFEGPAGRIRAVDGVDFDVERGETVCLVGESGAGKTVTCEAITRPAAGEVEGAIRFDGEDLTDASEGRLREVRGDRIAHVFQNPGNALDPVYTVGEAITEAIGYHRDLPADERRERAIDLLERVGIPRAGTRVDDHPHEFSGGMRQRAVIAVALANDPDLLIADEPTTALDVTVEAGILDLFRDLQAERDMAILFVTHDLGVVAEVADRVVVMYAGKAMERGGVHEIFGDPAHPYTRALLSCIPGRGDLSPIGGSIPEPSDPPDGCRFHPRCPHAVGDCRRGDQPPLRGAGGGQEASCVFYGEGRDAAVVRGEGGGENG